MKCPFILIAICAMCCIATSAHAADVYTAENRVTVILNVDPYSEVIVPGAQTVVVSGNADATYDARFDVIVNANFSAVVTTDLSDGLPGPATVNNPFFGLTYPGTYRKELVVSGQTDWGTVVGAYTGVVTITVTSN